jgi:hypothetical protein
MYKTRKWVSRVACVHLNKHISKYLLFLEVRLSTPLSQQIYHLLVYVLQTHKIMAAGYLFQPDVAFQNPKYLFVVYFRIAYVLLH